MIWLATLGLAVTMAAPPGGTVEVAPAAGKVSLDTAGKVSLNAVGTPLPEAMKALAARLGARLEMEGDFSDLLLTLQLENEEPAQAVRRIIAGWPVDYYLRGRGEVIILHRRDQSGGPKVVYQPEPVKTPQPVKTPDSVKAEVERAVDFISSLGQLTAEEKKRLREELTRNW